MVVEVEFFFSNKLLPIYVLALFHGLSGEESVGSQFLHSTLSDIFCAVGFPNGPGLESE